MKKIFIVGIFSLLFATFGFAYSADGQIKLIYTGYKTAKKNGVDGTFKNIKFSSKPNDSFVEFAKSLNVEIDGTQIDTKVPLRNKNIAIIFDKAKSSKILAKITDVKGDDKKGTMDIDMTINNVTKKVPFEYIVKNNSIQATSSIDVLDFALNDSFSAFAKKCKAFHAGKTWTDVGLKFSVSFTK